MLSIAPISGAGAAQYYAGLAREDYYTAGGEPPGRWVGEQALARGLEGRATAQQVSELFEGRDPATGAELRATGGGKFKPGWDATFSAPKSVSAIWATADQATREAISQAQQRAVERAAAYLSDNALVTRHGHAGREVQPAWGGMLACSFEHSTSRNGDPQLHTHLLIANVSADGRAVDLQTTEKMAAGAVYRVELAHELQRMGYQIERDGKSFRVAGVPGALVEEWSSRRAEVQAALEAAGQSGAKAAAVATLNSRDTKKEVDRAQSFQIWAETARQAGFDPRACRELAPREAQALDLAVIAREAVGDQSTVSEKQLRAAVVQAGQGHGNADEALARLDALKAKMVPVYTWTVDERGQTREGPTRWTTKEMHELEAAMAERADRMAQAHSHPVLQAVADQVIRERYQGMGDARGERVSQAQKEALHHVLGSEQIAVVQGVAGSGKSHMLGAAREAWERGGYEVQGAALAGKAAEGLQDSSGIRSTTIHGLLHQLETGQQVLHARSVVVVDEAGMIGSKLMAAVQTRCEEAGAKLVLVGDTQQLQPVDAGGAMRAIEDRVGSKEMGETIRQRDEAEAVAMLATRAGDAAETLRYLDSKGRIQDHDSRRDAVETAARESVKDRQAGKTSLVLVDTNADAKTANQAARAEARALGVVKGEDAGFSTSSGTRAFASGDRIITLKNSADLGVKNGTTGTVLEARKNSLTIQTDAGAVVKIEAGKYQDVDHGYATTVHKAQGATVDRAHYVPGAATAKESGYVALSRHREEVRVYLASGSHEREKLGEIIGRPELDKPTSQQEARAQARADLAKQLQASREKGTSIARAPAQREPSTKASQAGQVWLAQQRATAAGKVAHTAESLDEARKAQERGKSDRQRDDGPRRDHARPGDERSARAPRAANGRDASRGGAKRATEAEFRRALDQVQRAASVVAGRAVASSQSVVSHERPGDSIRRSGGHER